MTERNDIALKPSAAPRCWALIPCAGRGARAGLAGPKQYAVLAGKPMLLHTLAAFAEVSRIDQTLLVLAPDDDFGQTQATQTASFLLARCGGATRAQSVFNGLKALLEEGAVAHDWVLVHDGARCLITPALIDRLIDACLDDEVGGLLALMLTDTLKQARGTRVAGTLARHDKWLAQTPQMFRIGSLLEALEMADDAVTDDSSAIEALGLCPKLVAGSVENFKVTYPEDFALAQALLQSRQAQLD